MDRLAFFCATAILLTTAKANEPWRDPTVNSVNRLEARAIIVPCESEAKALSIARGEIPRSESAYLCSLNGTWNFKWKANFGDQ